MYEGDHENEDELLHPIVEPFAGDRPAGEDLRLDTSPSSIYFRLRDARAEARAEERKADDDPSAGAGTPAQWDLIRELALEALQSKSKDVEIACWLTEALTRHDGLAGLAMGANILVGLISNFWDGGLFPALEDDAPADRLIAITGMSGEDRDGSLLQPLRKIALFSRADGTPVTVWEFERAREIAGLAGSKAGHAEDNNAPSFLQLEADARGIGQASLRATANDAQRADASWQALERAVATVTEGEAIPATGRVRSMIELVLRLAERYAPDEPAAEPDAAGEASASDFLEQAVARPSVSGGAKPAEMREALLDELLRVASLFRQCEPNSPVSFTIEEAVRRARMTWPDLLRELIPDDNARAGVIAVSGMRPIATPPPE